MNGLNGVVAELVGGPHDGHRLRVSQLRERLERPIPIPGGELLLDPAHYQLDSLCVARDGTLAAGVNVARYLFRPPAAA